MKKIIVVSAVSVLFYITGCNSKKEEKEELTNYTATSPLKIDTSFNKEYVAEIKSVRNIELRAQEKGYLQNIYVDEGQSVKSGQLLFRIMPKMFQAELLKAQAESKAAEIELQNTKLLSDKNVVSKNEFLMAKAKLDGANAETSLAKMHLALTEIKAPFNGKINRIPLKVGSLVDEGALLTTLSDNNEMFAYFNVSEPEYLNYETALKDKGKQQVSLLMANNEFLKSKGTVETVESEFNNETGNIAFRARFNNPNSLLKNGETGKVQMLVPLKNALIIPQKATYEIQDKTYVFVIDKNNKVNARQITIANEIPDLYVIGAGLKENDKILLEGVQKVKEGDKIKFKYLAAREVINGLKLHAE